MFSRLIQQRARQFVAAIVRPLARLGITPNMVTLLGVLISLVTAVVIASGYIVAGGVLILFAGIFDMFDGAMARVRNAATTFGAFLTRHWIAIPKASFWEGCSIMLCSDRGCTRLYGLSPMSNNG